MILNHRPTPMIRNGAITQSAKEIQRIISLHLWTQIPKQCYQTTRLNNELTCGTLSDEKSV